MFPDWEFHNVGVLSEEFVVDVVEAEEEVVFVDFGVGEFEDKGGGVVDSGLEVLEDLLVVGGVGEVGGDGGGDGGEELGEGGGGLEEQVGEVLEGAGVLVLEVHGG